MGERAALAPPPHAAEGKGGVEGGTAAVTTILVSFGTTLATLAAAAVVVAFSRRSKASAEQGMSIVVSDLRSRLEALGGELSNALEQTQQESRRNRFLGELAGSIDLDEVLSRTLAAAGALSGVDAVLITLGRGGDQRSAAAGLTEEEIEEHAIGAPVAGRRLRAAALTYADPPEPGDLTAAVAIPLRGETAMLGLLTVFTRSETPDLDESLALELESLAEQAGPATENARRFREARQLADLDALTNLHNRRYFHETLAREVSRAHRYSRRLALLVLDLDDFKAVNDRIGHLAGDAVLSDIAERIREVVRSADVACRVGGDEFGVILPESALDDADQLYARLQAAITSRPLTNAGAGLSVSAGVAEVRPGDDPVSFFQRADVALYRAKEGGKGRAVSDGSGDDAA